MKMTLFLFIFLFFLLAVAVSADTYWDGLTKGYADTLYCSIGDCAGGGITADQNQTLVDYVLWVNSTNGVGGEGSGFVYADYFDQVLNKTFTVGFSSINLSGDINLSNGTINMYSSGVTKYVNIFENDYNNRYTGYRTQLGSDRLNLINYKSSTNFSVCGIQSGIFDNQLVIDCLTSGDSWETPLLDIDMDVYTSEHFIGNGSLLTDVCLSDGTNCQSTMYDDSWINSTIDLKILNNNDTQNDYWNYIVTGVETDVRNYMLNSNTTQDAKINYVSSLWNSNYTNMINHNCTGGVAVGIYPNGTFICETDDIGGAGSFVYADWFDQWLNTTSNVIFNFINATRIYIQDRIFFNNGTSSMFGIGGSGGLVINDSQFLSIETPRINSSYLKDCTYINTNETGDFICNKTVVGSGSGGGSINGTDINVTGIELNGSMITDFEQLSTKLLDNAYFLVYRNGDQSTANGVTTTVIFNAELYDPSSIHDTANGTVTITEDTAGLWYASCDPHWSNLATTKDSGALIYMGGSPFDTYTNYSPKAQHTAGLKRLVAGDTIYCAVYQFQGTINIRGTGYRTTMHGYRISK